MILFVTVILLAGWVQGIVKLSLLPRRVQWLWFAGMALLPLCLEKWLAASSLTRLCRTFLQADTLEFYCGWVVIQELWALVIGIGLIRELVFGRRLERRRFCALLPSLLAIPAAAGLELALLNNFLETDFRVLSFIASGILLFSGIGGCELLRLIVPERERRIELAVNCSYVLVLLAVFLPVAASRRLQGGVGTAVTGRDLTVLGVLLLLLAVIFAVFRIVHSYQNKRKA